MTSKPMFLDGVEYIHGMKMYRRDALFGGRRIQCLTMDGRTRVERIGDNWFIVTDDVFQQVITRVNKFCSTEEAVP